MTTARIGVNPAVSFKKIRLPMSRTTPVNPTKTYFANWRRADMTYEKIRSMVMKVSITQKERRVYMEGSSRIAFILRTPALDASSLIILKCPKTPVCSTCGPPQISRLNVSDAESASTDTLGFPTV